MLLYGSEAWALSSAQLHCLEVFHRQRLRFILGVRLADRIPATQLYERCRSCPIAVMLARRQLHWLRHLGRMGEGRVAKQMLYASMAAAGRRRRPGRQAPSLTDTYQQLVGQYLSAEQLRKAGMERRSRTWWDAAQNRALFRGACP